MPLTIQCPACESRLKVPENLLGKRVKCPSCKESFVAAESPPARSEAITMAPKPKAPPKEAIARPPKLPPKLPVEEVDDDLIEPEEEIQAEIKPKRRRSRDDDDEEEERPSKRRRRSRDDDDDDDYRPRRRRNPHRGGLILTLGILGLVLWCCPLLGWVVGGIAMNMAKKDLAEMDAGRMDRSGRGMTTTGNICAIITVVLLTINAVAGVILRVTGSLNNF